MRISHIWHTIILGQRGAPGFKGDRGNDGERGEPGLQGQRGYLVSIQFILIEFKRRIKHLLFSDINLYVESHSFTGITRSTR